MSRAQHFQQAAPPWLSSALCYRLSSCCCIIFIHVSCGMTLNLSHSVNHAQAGAGAEGTCSLSVVTMKGLRYRCCCRDPTAHGPSTITASDRQQQALLLLQCCCCIVVVWTQVKWLELAARCGQLFNGIPLSVWFICSWSGRKRENVGQVYEVPYQNEKNSTKRELIFVFISLETILFLSILFLCG